MFRKILIANRGEIAVTIIRACREMGIRSVAVFSEADRSSLHAQLADEAICIGPAASRDSYLNIQSILTAARVTGAEAIHPGYGFLSENATFARICDACGFVFIGPTEQMIARMGDKASARAAAREAGIPVIPGSPGIVDGLAGAVDAARSIGFPLMIKAAAGGGGRGMRIAHNQAELETSFQTAATEARNCFSDDRMYLERLVENPRHIEIQLLADQYGHAIHLGDRDCSIQRRHQKMLEEAVSPFTDSDLRAAMGEAAVRLAGSIGYRGAGTVEFLVDDNRQFYFMEMNTRIQVEHPVSEAVTGINLIQAQIRMAAGEPLAIRQEDVSFSGHSIECRINAEDPLDGFRPSPGVVTSLHLPGGPGVRVDSALYQGCRIPPDYDSMLAKLIVHAPTRPEAIARMRRALMEFLISGLATTVDFHMAIMRDPDFISGHYHIGFLDEKMPLLLEQMRPVNEEETP